MPIRVRFFAGLRERMGRAELAVSSEGLTTVCDVWKAVSGGDSMPEHMLAAVNLEHTTPQHAVKDGDEVAFFPPVTGG